MELVRAPRHDAWSRAVSPRLTTLVAWLAAAGVAACDLPRDADGTLDRVRGGIVRVGVVVDTPWVTDSAGGEGAAGGIEGALVQGIARDIGARVRWIRGTDESLLAALHARELDMVIGGLTTESPWKATLAFTKPYYTDTVIVAGAPGAPAPTTLAGLRVAVVEGDPIVARVRSENGIPVPVADLATAREAIAAPTWRLAQLGGTPLARTGNPAIVLGRREHVLALPPGENAWLVHVERWLRAHESRIPTMLREAPR
jgi:polar amino acid transport system substrate-binding protein